MGLPVIQTSCLKAFLGIKNIHTQPQEQKHFSFVELYSDVHTLLLEIHVSPCINGFTAQYFLFSSNES